MCSLIQKIVWIFSEYIKIHLAEDGLILSNFSSSWMLQYEEKIDMQKEKLNWLE